MKINSKLYIFFLFSCFNIASHADLTIVGPVKMDDGIFRLGLIWIQQLKANLKVNFLSTGFVDLKNVDTTVKKIISNSLNRVNYIKKNPGNVSVLLSSPWTIWGNHADHVPNSKIKIAYSMLEGTKIPDQWVKNFNDKFDAVVVPDKYFVEIYQNCGVKVPIFVLPIALMLNDFLNQPIKRHRNKIFRFGTSAVFIPGKNHETTLRAFIHNFKNNPEVELYLHGRGGSEKKLLEIIKKSNTKNAYIINKSLPPIEYLKFLKSLDCYVLLSQGEGFSITPREAMSLGIPCVLSDNTAQKTICQTGLVEVVKSEILIPAYYSPFGCNVGHKFKCTLNDACVALQNVYNNYETYLKKSYEMRNWAAQYNYKQMTQRYLSLVKPKTISLGNDNIIANDKLITDSKALYEKYLSIIKG